MSDFVYEPEKCTEIIELDISDEEFLKIAKAAHALDITFNHYVNLAVHTAMERFEEEEAAKEQAATETK